MSWSRQILRRSALGAVVAIALVCLSFANWFERGQFEVPEDGVLWTDRDGAVVAVRVTDESPGAQVGVRPGDRLDSIGGFAVREALDVPVILAETGAWNRTEYRIERHGRPLQLSVVPAGSAGRGTIAAFLLVLGWAYAAIGLWVCVRCTPTVSVRRFYTFCVASLAVYSLSATGSLQTLDRAVYWIDVWGLLLMPPLFLDFCTCFPDNIPRYRRAVRSAYAVAVAVAAAHHAAAGGWVSGGIPDATLLQFFDTAPLVLLAANLAAGAYIVRVRTRVSEEPLWRLQANCLMLGTVAAVGPFTFLYALPFAAGLAPGPNQAFSVFSLALLPVAIAVALLRYRLLDLEVFRRRVLAAAASIALLGASIYGLLFVPGIPAPWLERHAPLLWLGSLGLAAGLYRPLYNRLASVLERRAYRGRYRDRKTLASFGSELSAETDVNRMIRRVALRLTRTLDVDRVLLLVPDAGADGSGEDFRVLPETEKVPLSVDMSPVRRKIQRTAGPLSIGGPLEAAFPDDIAQLGCHQFVPCQVRGRTMAWIAMGRTTKGDLLSSEDLSLVEALAAPFAIALENARLYTSLDAKASQYQRLKDYNENIVESLSVGILVLDGGGRIQSWNAHLELSFGISREDARGRFPKEILPARLVDAFEGCTDESGAGSVYRFRLRADEFPEPFRPTTAEQTSERFVHVVVAPLIDKEFQRVGQLLIVDDVTEQLELEQRVIQADKLSSVGLLAAGVAHEVNTPLAVISSYSQILASRFARQSDEARILGKVTEQTFRASEIVNSLLDFSRTAGPEMSTCDLNRTIENSVELLSPQLQRSGVTVVKDLRDPAEVLASSGRLQQVFLNLFLNARDAMPDGGTLSLSTRSAEDPDGEPVVRVLVADTGTGIPPDRQGRIFDPFFTTKGPRQGTGLGLAVSYGIVREHSGTISVESQPGQGTTFELRFPLARHPVHG